MKMNRRQLFLSTAKAALAAAFGGSWLSPYRENAPRTGTSQKEPRP
jgi:hypothetical protein